MWGWLERPPYPFVRRVEAHLKGPGPERAFEGVLWKRCNGFLVLKHATLHQVGRDPLKFSGEVLLPEREVDFLEVHGEAEP